MIATIGTEKIAVKLSVVIPAFNEQDRIGKTLERVQGYLERLPFMSEILVIDDGSTDATAQLVESYIARMRNLTLLRNSVNEGKGAAVRVGMLAAKGETRVFMDADNSTDISHLDEALEAIRHGADIVVGSRRVAGAAMMMDQPVARRIAGAGFRLLVRFLFKLPVKDTQNGFKAFSANAAQVTFAPLKTRGWAFDVEILDHANRLGFDIREMPVAWFNDERSRLKLYHSIGMGLDVISLRSKSNWPGVT